MLSIGGYKIASKLWHTNKAFVLIWWWWLLIVLICYCVTGYNFSHRIDHLSFGEAIPGIISPLDGTEKVSAECTSALSYINKFFVLFLFIDMHRLVLDLKLLFPEKTDNWQRRLSLFPSANHMFQYFITIVPTKLNTYKVSAETHQYSVTEQVGLQCEQVCIFV